MAKKRAAKSQAGGEHSEAPAAVPLVGDKRTLRLWNQVAVGIVVLMLIIVVLASRTHVSWPVDHFSDMNTLLAGENFANYGLVNLRFLPVLYGPALGEVRRYYTHYPPLPDVMNGIMRMVGIDGLSGMRIVCGVFAVAGLFCAYRGFAMVIGPAAAALGLLAVATSGFFVNFGISVHQHAYNMLFLGVFILLFLKADRGAAKAKWMWAGCWGAMFLGSLASFEFILYPQVFAWIYVLATGKFRQRWKVLLILATASMAGLGLHFLQNVWAIGWSAAAEDCLGYGQYGGESRLKALRSLPDNLLKNAMQFFYWPWLVLPLLGAGCLIVLHVQKTASDSLRKVGALLLGVLVAPLGWYIFMAAHVHHPHTVSQLWPLFFVTIGLVAAGVFSLLLRPGTQWWMRLVMVMAAFVLIFAQYKSVTMVTQRSGGLPNAMLAEAIGPNAFGHKKGVLFNTAAVAQAAYYLRNSASLCPQHGIRFPEDLPLMRKSLPEDWELKWYVFFGGGNLELFKFLASNCPGEILVVRNFNPPRYVLRFDMRELLKPPDQRKPLDQGIRQRQLKMDFSEWKVEGFWERFRQIVRRHSR